MIDNEIDHKVLKTFAIKASKVCAYTGLKASPELINELIDKMAMQFV